MNKHGHKTDSQYMDLMQARRNFICILPKSEMHTEQGTVRKYWLHKFYELNPEDKKRVRIPKVGAIAEERITIKVPNYGSFYLLSYKKEHRSVPDY